MELLQTDSKKTFSADFVTGMLIEETDISGNHPVLLKLANGDSKVMRLQIGGKMLPEIRIGKVKIPGMVIISSIVLIVNRENASGSKIRFYNMLYNGFEIMGSCSAK